MKLIETILNSPWLATKPPVLIDIGASGEINSKWKPIASRCICIAFDADDREFQVKEESNAGFKKLIRINRIVTEKSVEATDFYLTASPFCSSLLEPSLDKLEPWIFQSLFQTEKKISLKAITVSEAMKQAGIDYIDWFKTDTQGTDLRLFLSVPDSVREQILAAELEPGIIDAYQGEDKLYSILQTLPAHGFWLSTMEVKGTQRIKESWKKTFGEFSSTRIVRRSPCWAELTYLRTAKGTDQRGSLLLILFAILERQYGFALEVTDHAQNEHGDAIFSEVRTALVSQINNEKWKLPLVMIKKQFNKMFSRVNA